MEIAILIGLPAAGKSTFAARTFDAGHVVVSKDALRNNRRPAHRQAELIAQALAAGRSVVVDNTNPTLADRAALIALGRAHGATIVGYTFPPDVAGSRRRNAARSGPARVPDVAIYAAAKRLVPPTYAEGFDRLYAVALTDDGFAVSLVAGSPDGAVSRATE